jgi:ABC-type antimicrobial peptide transport system permease subunit
MQAVTLVARHGGRTVIPQVRTIVHDLDPGLPIVDAQPLTSYIGLGLVPQQIALAVAASLGLVGLFLAGLGVYGVMACAVAARTREIGVRVALGATRGDVLRLVYRRSLGLGIAGIGAGSALALGGAQALRSLLYGIGPSDALTYVTAAALFVAVTLVATCGPARRAIGVNPVGALRTE